MHEHALTTDSFQLSTRVRELWSFLPTIYKMFVSLLTSNSKDLVHSHVLRQRSKTSVQKPFAFVLIKQNRLPSVPVPVNQSDTIIHSTDQDDHSVCASRWTLDSMANRQKAEIAALAWEATAQHCNTDGIDCCKSAVGE